MTDTTYDDEARLRRATLFGAVAGFRSLLPLGLMARAVDVGELPPPKGTLGRFLQSPQVRIGLQLAALGELALDKLPIVPSRTKPSVLFGRIGLGALCAATLAGEIDAPVLPAAARGAAGAGLAAFAGYAYRVLGGRLTGLPDLVVALGEDVIAVGIGQQALRGGDGGSAGRRVGGSGSV